MNRRVDVVQRTCLVPVPGDRDAARGQGSELLKCRRAHVQVGSRAADATVNDCDADGLALVCTGFVVSKHTIGDSMDRHTVHSDPLLANGVIVGIPASVAAIFVGCSVSKFH